MLYRSTTDLQKKVWILSYDYSSSSATLELPNPYKVQNRALFVSGAVLLCGGLSALFTARNSLAAIPLALGLGLVLLGLTSFAVAARRLRFFFGRGRPHSLAPEIPPTATGTSPAATAVKRLLRDGALTYPEPVGAVDGVLYHWFPRLITAPLAVQDQARSAFFNLCAMLAATVSFIAAWGVFGNEGNRLLLSVAYFAFGLIFLLRPIVGAGKAQLNIRSLALLITATVVGPALLGALGKAIGPAVASALAKKGISIAELSLAPQTFMLLISGTLAAALLLLSALQQVAPPPPTQTSMEQLRLSLNVPPSLLLDELERRMQEQWTERIPNRRYARTTPVIDPSRHSGPFAGELLEESQPTPMQHMVPASILQAFSSKPHRFLTALDLYATALVVIATVCAVLFAHGSAPGLELPLKLFGASSIFLVVAGFCFRSSALLWGRFNFESVITWVEMEGTYQTASMGTGFTAKVQTSNQIVRTEAMTLRVWRARIESVVFGKEGQRQITAMFSTDKESKELAQHLADFGRSRSSMVAPDSPEDMKRIAALANAERAMASASGAPSLADIGLAALAAPSAGQPPAQITDNGQKTKFCRHCGAKNNADARFCQGCGEKFEG